MNANNWLARPIALAVSSCFGLPVLANPTAPQVMQGTAAFQGLGTNNLQVTNSPNAVIHWQGFSIDKGQLTNFVQQSASSAVLNRVVGANISEIQGKLSSNGRVFLINPAGILIGATGIIDTAGFVGSTLNMLDADFLAGKLKFTGGPNAGSIINNGTITAKHGGSVVLVAPHIENSKDAIIQTPGGELLLAAGQKVSVGGLDPNGVQFEVQAPTDSVLNLGKLIADGGLVGVFAGTLKHSGDIRAGALVRDEGGRIVLKAQSDILLAAGSTTSANGKSGGDIVIQSTNGQARVSGDVSAAGSSGKGGDVQVLGERVSIVDHARVDASGTSGGGQIRVGGDYQGKNSAIQNASHAFVGPDALLTADAGQTGDGGRVIVWADNTTQFYGGLSARGGSGGGNGGFAEVSGKQTLIFEGKADLAAPNGRIGDLLLDPLDLFVDLRGGFNASLIDEASDVAGNAVTISPDTLRAISGNVTLFAGRYMRFNSTVDLSNVAGKGITATVASYSNTTDPLGTPPNRMELGANIITNGGAVSLTAPSIVDVAASNIVTNGGAVTMTADKEISAFSTTIDALTRGTGGAPLGSGGAVNLTSGSSFVGLGSVSGGSLTVTAPDFIQTGNIATFGPVALTSFVPEVPASGGAPAVPEKGNSISTGNIDSGGGAVAITARQNINTGNTVTGGGGVFLNSVRSTVASNLIDSGNGNVTLTGTGINPTTIHTSGAVNLTASNGTIGFSQFSPVTVNGASSLTASSTRSSGSGVYIASATSLNANLISANTPCAVGTFNCRDAEVSVIAVGDVNVGTVTATTTRGTNPFNIPSESVAISSSAGSIRALSSSSKVSAKDVTLATGPGTGGGIGTAATALNVSAKRTFTIRPNGEFNVQLVDQAPAQFVAEIGTGTFSNSVVNGGGISLNASGTPTGVTINNLTISGLTENFEGTTPFLEVTVPNGTLTANSINVPTPVTAALPVTIGASGDVAINAFTRSTSAGTSFQQTTFNSTSGSVQLGAIAAAGDFLTVNARNNIFIGSVAADAGVSMTTNCIFESAGCLAGQGTIGAAADNPAFEVTSAGSINITTRTIGTQGGPGGAFSNPLDLQGNSITLSSTASSVATGSVAGPPTIRVGQIGFDGAPVIANTTNLTIVAPQGDAPPAGGGPASGVFFVDTGSTPLQNLAVSFQANSSGQVTSNAKTYTFNAMLGSVSFNPGAIPVDQFNGGTLSLTNLATGDIQLGNVNVGAGSFIADARDGSIFGIGGTPPLLDGSGTIDLFASRFQGADGTVQINVGDIGSLVRPSSVNIVSGTNNGAIRAGVFTRNGSITTGDIMPADGGTVDLKSVFGTMNVGNIGSSAPGGRADSVTLLGDTSSGGGTGGGAVSTGDIFGATLALTTNNAGLTTGNLSATSGMTLRSRNSISTGTLDAPQITIGDKDGTRPSVAVGAIGSAIPVSNLSITGATSVTFGGLITADTTAPGSFIINGAGQVGGPGGAAMPAIVAGDGSTIDITSGGGAFQFSELSAGASGSVTINSEPGIQTTAAAPGITAGRVNLTTSTGNITETGGAAAIALHGTSDLTVSTRGRVNLNSDGTPLTSLNVTKRATATAQPFILSNLGPGQSVTVTGSANDAILNVSSGSALNFKFDYQPLNSDGTALVGAISTNNTFITTAGGFIDLKATGAINAGSGGFTSGGGFVQLIAVGGGVTTGTIDSADPVSGGGSINVSTSCSTGSCGIDVNGNLTTGMGGGAVTLGVDASGSATGSIVGVGSITSDSRVSLGTNHGDIGSAGAKQVIRAPDVVLTAQGAGFGNVFADIQSTPAFTTTRLALTADNGFDVSSIPINELSVATRGSRSGTFTLTGAGDQTFDFARTGLDFFSTASPNTVQINTLQGGATLTKATVSAIDGDLLIGGNAAIGVPELVLNTGAGDIKLQGTAATPLLLTNGTQDFLAQRDLNITGNVAVSATSGKQNLAANRDLNAQAQNGTILISHSGSGGQFVTAAGNVSLLAGALAGETARIVHTGTGGQTIGESTFGSRVTDNITVGAGAGAGAFSEVTSTENQSVFTAGTLTVQGGAGAGAFGRIATTGAGRQKIGLEPGDSGFRIANIVVKGGTLDSAGASIVASAEQSIHANSSATLTGGSAADTEAVFQTTGAGSQSVSIGGTGLVLQGGTGARARAQVIASAGQNITRDGSTMNVSVIGGGGTDASARITAAGAQQITFANMLVKGGTADGTFAMIDSGSSQTLSSGSSLTITAGGTQAAPLANAGAIVQGPSQKVDCLFSCVITLNGGAGTAAGASDALLLNLSGDQVINARSLTLNGGFSRSTTAVRNLPGAGTQTIRGQAFDGDVIVRSSADTGSDAAVSIENLAGTSQSVTASRNVMVESRASGPASITSAGAQTFSAGGTLTVRSAGTAAAAMTSSGDQTLTGGAGLVIDAQHTGSASITAPGKQKINAGYVSVSTRSSGAATLAANGNQWIATTNGALNPDANGSFRVVALGSGAATVQSGGTQLLEIDYPGFITTSSRSAPPGSIVIGAADAGGPASVTGVDQLIFSRAVTVQGGSVTNAAASLAGSHSQAISVLDGSTRVLAGSGFGSTAGITSPTQTLVMNNSVAGSPALSMASSGGTASASITSTNGQDVFATRGDIALAADHGAVLIQTTNGPQRVEGAGALGVTGGSGGDALARISTGGTQTLKAPSINLRGGTGSGAFAQLHSDGVQSIGFTELALTAGAGAGSFARIDTPSAQTLTGGSGDIALTASTGAGASIDGQNQVISCGPPCDLILTGANSGAGNAQIVNLSGQQTINVGSIVLLGGGSTSTTGILNQGTGDQVVTAANSITLDANPAATGASVLIQNAPGTAQLITAGGDLGLFGNGSGTVAVTSAGTQAIDARGLDVVTHSGGAGGANATVFSVGNQSIHTRGSLAGAPGVGMRVASLSSGNATVSTTGNQVINVDGAQLLIGRLQFGPAGPIDPTSGNPAFGDSLVLATSATSDPNQAVNAGSLFIQGPSGDFRVSKLSADGVQVVTVAPGGISVIGGSGTDSFAVIDPTNQTINSAGPILLQGGSGPNADALVNATGPQSVTSQNGFITLQGGTGRGADALIATTSPFQTVQGVRGSGPIILNGTGGIAGLQHGNDNGAGALQLASNGVMNEIVREQDRLYQSVRDAELETENDRNQKRATQICR